MRPGEVLYVTLVMATHGREPNAHAAVLYGRLAAVGAPRRSIENRLFVLNVVRQCQQGLNN